eukprot:4182693-Pleurochrysis_carterae.AAC.1
MSEGQRPSMQSLKACCSKAHCTATQNLAIESGFGYNVPSDSKSRASSACKPAMTETGKEASAASKRARLPSNCSSGSAASASFLMLYGVGLSPCRSCSSVGTTSDAAWRIRVTSS